MKIFTMAFAITFGLTSCEKEDTAKPLEVDFEHTATIKGSILVNADITKATADQKWSAPDANIVVEATVRYSDLNSNASNSGVYRTTGTYNKSKGEYTVTVPVANQATLVRLTVYAFNGTLKMPVNGNDKTVNVIWDETKTLFLLTPNEVKHYDIKKDGAFHEYTAVVVDGSSVN